MQLAQSRPQLSQLVEAVVAADLVEFLSGSLWTRQFVEENSFGYWENYISAGVKTVEECAKDCQDGTTVSQCISFNVNGADDATGQGQCYVFSEPKGSFIVFGTANIAYTRTGMCEDI